jgi:glycosyltransferase involved in cell wall biosynthesis
VGDESDGGCEYFEAIRAMIADSGYAARFVLTGYREDVEEYYAAVDIVVHASVAPEPFGMVVPEGMAARRPVIATDAGGPREVVSHGMDGLLVPPGDVPALAEAILELASDSARRARMGARGRQKVLDRFRIATNADRVREVYDGVLGPAGLRRTGSPIDADPVEIGPSSAPKAV